MPLVSGRKKICDSMSALEFGQAEIDRLLTVQMTITIEKLPNGRKVPNPIYIGNHSQQVDVVEWMRLTNRGKESRRNLRDNKVEQPVGHQSQTHSE